MTTAQRYAEYYDSFYETAKVGQTTSVEAEQQAHYMTQRLMCQTDMVYLAEQIFDMDKARNEGRKIWHPPIHHKLCRELEGNQNSLIHMSRNMLKSSVAKIWVVQQILADPANVAIGMWSKNTGRVRIMLSSITAMLENPKLLELFPDRLTKGKRKKVKATQNELTIRRDIPNEDGVVRQIPIDENQIEVWGLDSTVTGRHYTHHFYDDIIDRSNSSTATMIEKTQEIWEAIQAMKSPATIEKMIGTPWHQLDLYAEARSEGFFDSEINIPGLLQDGSIVYPWYTKDFLQRQRGRMSEYLFSCQYLLDTRPKSHKLFTLPVPMWSDEDFPRDAKYYVSVDPSTGKHERTDKTGICVGAVSRSNPTHVFYVEADSYRLRPEEVAEEVVRRIIKYTPEKVGVEFGLQQALYPLIKAKLNEEKAKRAMPIREPVWVDIKTGGGAGALNKADKIDRTLGAMVRDRRAYFRPDMKRLFHQMATFNPNVQKNEDDILDAAGMLIQTIEHFYQAHWFGVEERGVPGFTEKYLEELFFGGEKKGAKADRIFA